jgi:hypothetical protein
VHDSNSIASLQHCVPQPLLVEHACSWKAHSGAVALVATALSQPPAWYSLGECDGIQQVRALHGVPLGDFPLPNLTEVRIYIYIHTYILYRSIVFTQYMLISRALSVSSTFLHNLLKCYIHTTRSIHIH